VDNFGLRAGVEDPIDGRLKPELRDDPVGRAVIDGCAGERMNAGADWVLAGLVTIRPRELFP